MCKPFLNLLLLVLLSSHVGMTQTRTLNGTVSDASDGSFLPGVSVVIKGTARGTVTDRHGAYTIELNPADSILVFHFMGMLSQEVKVIAQSRLDVNLEPELATLSEIVVVGYGGPSRRLRNAVGGILSSEKSYQAAAVNYPVADFNTESYSTIHETDYKEVWNNPLSTFSIDVDQAAYSNVRRFLNNGQLPPVDAVRIEEMLNYFSYNYPEPTGEHPFAMHTELSQCPWNAQTQLLRVGLQARQIDKDRLPVSNLVFLIDVSGSMSPANRLPLVKTALNLLLEELRPTDRVSIVIYAGETRVLLESTSVRHKERIRTAINSLRAGGGTAGGQALRMAYAVAENNFIEGGNNRIILCTDGDFNLGESSNAAMERLVEQERQKGVYITVLGFGMGNYKDDRLEIIANKGNGNYAYIDNIQEARKVLVSEFAGTLFTLANDVKIQIEFNPARVKAYRLIGYENRRLQDEDFNNDIKDAGELGAGHAVTALYEIIPAGSAMAVPGTDPLKYQERPAGIAPNTSAELLTLKARYKNPGTSHSVLVDLPVRGKVVAPEQTSEDFRFAAAVAEFGLLLRNSPFKAQANYEQVIQKALAAKGKDEDGYRAEFINLVRTASNLQKLGAR